MDMIEVLVKSNGDNNIYLVSKNYFTDGYVSRYTWEYFSYNSDEIKSIYKTYNLDVPEKIQSNNELISKLESEGYRYDILSEVKSKFGENGNEHILVSPYFYSGNSKDKTQNNSEISVNTIENILGFNKNRCGDDAYWNFDESTGELIISGTGAIYDYDDACPIFSYAPYIAPVLRTSGIYQVD